MASGFSHCTKGCVFAPKRCIQGVNNKAQALTDYCRDQQIALNDVTYVGNDINDLDVIILEGTTFCTADAHSSIKQISQYILES